jgi:hypothetical protein
VELTTTGIQNGKKRYNILIDEWQLIIKWESGDEPPYWIFFYSNLIDEEYFGVLFEDTPCPFGTYTIEEGSIFEAFEVEPCISIPVIKIKGCDTCWEVTETNVPINPGIVTVTASFPDCIACTPPLSCLCNRITNYSTESKEYEYIDCDDESVLITLAAGQTSGKICLKRWVIDYPDTDNLEVFGDCVLGSGFCYEYNITISPDTSGTLYYKNCSNNVESQLLASQRTPYIITICGIDGQTSNDIYLIGSRPVRFEKTTVCYTPTLVCPETRPKRKITPGYSVPTCDTDKWEKITCRSSEILYKEVMRLRYGMSNCCPEDDEKWLIKKELIDLAALVDPNYICSPVQTCGCPPSSCGCGCSSTLKTCSSQ